ncbi:hypothetical protein Ctob_003053 [Chrysochromulina tobinii]|uniref:Uncharacterized protein n=1 Tax=Chrysochromulina tobinii TaxID=1460289 RepID=A0A0M0JFP5_9EUKA|nr:hypothetical protein Ctob_003053 [Chrysochromulina tobinii]|eukprot:KOO25411.1 hypothetical protein Ctob_003053 [Chrysochromulina sp. CCMP291]
MPPTVTDARYLLLSRLTQANPVSLSAGTSWRPSCTAASMACSAVSHRAQIWGCERGLTDGTLPSAAAPSVAMCSRARRPLAIGMPPGPSSTSTSRRAHH